MERLFLVGVARPADLVRRFVIAGAAAVEDQRHQSDADDDRKEDAERHGDVAMFRDRRAGIDGQTLVTEPAGGREDR